MPDSVVITPGTLVVLGTILIFVVPLAVFVGNLMNRVTQVESNNAIIFKKLDDIWKHMIKEAK